MKLHTMPENNITTNHLPETTNHNCS